MKTDLEDKLKEKTKIDDIDSIGKASLDNRSEGFRNISSARNIMTDKKDSDAVRNKMESMKNIDKIEQRSDKSDKAHTHLDGSSSKSDAIHLKDFQSRAPSDLKITLMDGKKLSTDVLDTLKLGEKSQKKDNVYSSMDLSKNVADQMKSKGDKLDAIMLIDNIKVEADKNSVYGDSGKSNADNLELPTSGEKSVMDTMLKSSNLFKAIDSTKNETRDLLSKSDALDRILNESIKLELVDSMSLKLNSKIEGEKLNIFKHETNDIVRMGKSVSLLDDSLFGLGSLGDTDRTKSDTKRIDTLDKLLSESAKMNMDVENDARKSGNDETKNSNVDIINVKLENKSDNVDALPRNDSARGSSLLDGISINMMAPDDNLFLGDDILNENDENRNSDAANNDSASRDTNNNENGDDEDDGDNDEDDDDDDGDENDDDLDENDSNNNDNNDNDRNDNMGNASGNNANGDSDRNNGGGGGSSGSANNDNNDNNDRNNNDNANSDSSSRKNSHNLDSQRQRSDGSSSDSSRMRMEKKKKRKQEESTMGPPEKIPAKHDAVAKACTTTSISLSSLPPGLQLVKKYNSQQSSKIGPGSSSKVSDAFVCVSVLNIYCICSKSFFLDG